MICTAISYLIYAILLFVNMRPFCRQRLKMVISIPILLITLGLLFAFARTPMVIIVKPFILASITYSMFIYKMMSDYISLVSRKMTFKERLTRKRS